MTRIEYRWREPYHRPEDVRVPPPEHAIASLDGMVVERNVGIELSDGVILYADVFRPLDAAPAAPIIAWTPYGKHQNGSAIYAGGKAGVPEGAVSAHATFEGPDPRFWDPRGYAVVNVDLRGMYHSEGDATFVSPEETEDFYEVIEWAGTQPWSNGKVGLSGVSYLAVSQWRVAALRPPHLAAINPWEGWTDTYREVVRHGGIPDTWFWGVRLADSWGTGTGRIEDLVTETAEHPFFDDYWASKAAMDLEQVEVPAYVVACWADQGLHLRGTLEGFKRISSPSKWLEVHGRKKWAYYYEPGSVQRLAEFFDHFLLGKDTAVTSWAKVRLELRERYLVGAMRAEGEWPIARTRYTPLFLDAGTGSMRSEGAGASATAVYDALGSGPGAHRAVFEAVFEEPTDLIGHAKARLWMSAEGSDDMDVFVGLYKFDAAGAHVPLAYYTFFEDGPIALGWQRASHRELDEERSSEFQPVLAHRRELTLRAGEIVPLDIEIWPSATRFEAGERLRLIVQGSDLQKYSKTLDPIYTRHEDGVNAGRHRIHTGGEHESYLLLPVVPGA